MPFSKARRTMNNLKENALVIDCDSTETNLNFILFEYKFAEKNNVRKFSPSVPMQMESGTSDDRSTFESSNAQDR